MTKIKILLYSRHDTKRIIYEDSDGAMIADIEETYLRRCKVKNYMCGGAKIEVCKQTRDALQDLESKYDSATKFHIRKLRGFISKLEDGDFFYFFNEDNASVVERRTAMDCINAVKAGLPWAITIHNNAFHYYSMMNIHFTYLSYGFDGLGEKIGEEDKSKRVCRFCGRKMPEVTFDKVAHAIQEALGNKLLVCYEECDTCNHDLALTEDNFRYIMDFRRAMYHIPRKGATKTPTVVGKTFIIKAGDQGDPQLYLMEEALPDAEIRKHPFMMHLELKSPINNERMYKALCKMVIDMLPSGELLHFENTIKWINSPGDWAPDALPSVLLTVLPSIIYKDQPIIDIFINNRTPKQDAPYCTAVVWLYDIAYMFVVPLVDVDGGLYKYDENLKDHWAVMSNLIGIHQWQEQDTSNYMLSTPWVDWLIDLSLPNVHVLPKADPIFEKCLEERPKMPDFEMPEFKREGIQLHSVDVASFTSLYHHTITDKDLCDITQHISGPVFILLPKEHKVRIQMSVTANDTTDKIPYFKFNFSVTLVVDSFNDYISIEYDENGGLDSFALHYELRDYLIAMAMVHAELRLRPQRLGTGFEKCELGKMLDSDRLVANSIYYVPYDNDNHYVLIKDRDIHRVGYED